VALFCDLGNRLGQAEALNNLGELSSRTSATGQARDHHNGALEIARDIGAPLEEARALEGTGRTYLQDGNPGQAGAYLRSALTIYQRIGAPGARRVQGTLRQHGLTATPGESREGLSTAKALNRARAQQSQEFDSQAPGRWRQG
jgi:tetratricopeptide (TPR) repeat protein